jgi:hypothetical protein
MGEYRHDGKFIQPATKIADTGTSVRVGQVLNSRPDTRNAKGQGKSSKKALRT